MENSFGFSQNMQVKPGKNCYDDGGDGGCSWSGNDEINENSTFYSLAAYYVSVPFLSV